MSAAPVSQLPQVVIAAPQQPALQPPKPAAVQAAVSAIAKAVPKPPTTEQILNDLEREIVLTQEVIHKEEARFFRWTKVDLSKERSLIATLASKVAAILKGLFDKLYATVKTRPMTVAEEQELAGVAFRLQNAYKLAGADEPAAQAGHDGLCAAQRADTKREQSAKLAGLRKEINESEEWVKTSRFETLRSLPIVNWFAWTTQQVKLDMAQKEVQIIEAQMPDVRPYPDLLRPKISDLGKAKEALAAVQTPDTRENLATRRQVREHSEAVQKLEKLEIATAKVRKVEGLIKDAAVRPIATTYPAQMKAHYEDLIKAKEGLAKEYAAGSPEAITLQNEIKDLNSAIDKFRWMR